MNREDIYNTDSFNKYETVTRDDGEYFLERISNMSEYMNVHYDRGEVVIEGAGEDEFIDGLLENRIVQAIIAEAIFETHGKEEVNSVVGSYKSRKKGSKRGTNPKISIEFKPE